MIDSQFIIHLEKRDKEILERLEAIFKTQEHIMSILGDETKAVAAAIAKLQSDNATLTTQLAAATTAAANAQTAEEVTAAQTQIAASNAIANPPA